MELPRLQPLFDTYAAQGFEILAVDGKRDTERARKFVEKHNLRYTFVENGEADAEVVKAIFGVRSYPTSFLIDRQGRIMYYHLGFEPGDEQELAEQIETLL